jgi:hypothetical protein
MTADESFEPMKDPQWVPVITVPTDAQAEQYRELLTDHDMVVLVGLDQWEAHGSAGADDENRKPGVPVLVLDHLLEEARGIIVEREGESVFDPDVDDDDDDEHDLDFDHSEEDDQEHLFMDEDDHAADPLDELPEFDAPPTEDEENHHYH